MDAYQQEEPKKKKKIWLYVLLGIVGAVAGLLIIGGVITLVFSNQQTRTEITFGGDTIPTVYTIVGERKVSGVESGVNRSGGVTTRTTTLSYQAGVISEDDLELYIGTLIEKNDFLITRAFNGSSMQIGKESVDSGKILVVEVNFNALGSTVFTYTKVDGTLTRY